jgi:hypothetical protein
MSRSKHAEWSLIFKALIRGNLWENLFMNTANGGMRADSQQGLRWDWPLLAFFAQV